MTDFLSSIASVTMIAYVNMLCGFIFIKMYAIFKILDS